LPRSPTLPFMTNAVFNEVVSPQAGSYLEVKIKSPVPTNITVERHVREPAR